jgi:hypothetical protein
VPVSAWKVVLDEYTGKRTTESGPGGSGKECFRMPGKIFSITFTATGASKKHKYCLWGHKDDRCQPGLDDKCLSCKGKKEWKHHYKNGPINFKAYEVRCGEKGHSRTDPESIHNQQVAAQGSCPHKSDCGVKAFFGFANSCEKHCGRRGAHHLLVCLCTLDEKVPPQSPLKCCL